MNRDNHTCQICGKPLTVVIRGRSSTERFCARCLVTVYPALRELAKRIAVI